MRFWITNGILHHEATTVFSNMTGQSQIYSDEGQQLDILEDSSEIEIPEGVVCIGEMAFSSDYLHKTQWNKLKKVKLPSSIKEIGKRAFDNCTALSDINLPEGLETIGYMSFRRTAIKQAHLPESLMRIEDNCFYASKVEEIVLPKSKTEISKCAFISCQNLKHINVPDYVDILLCFMDCSSLEEVNIPHAEDGFYGYSGCRSLKKIHIPEGTKSIERGALVGCSGLQEIYIPNTVNTIKEDFVAGCVSLRELALPASVKSVECSFTCTYLKRIVIKSAIRNLEKCFIKTENVEQVAIAENKAGKARIVFPNADIYNLEDELLLSNGSTDKEGKNAVKLSDDIQLFVPVKGEIIPGSGLPKFVKCECALSGQQYCYHVVLSAKGAKSINEMAESIYTQITKTGVWKNLDEPISFYSADELSRKNLKLYVLDSHTGEKIPVFDDEYSRKYSRVLSEEEALDDLKSFVSVILQCLNVLFLEKLLEYAPHNKNGKLAKNRTILIAKSGIANCDGMSYVLMAKNTSDLELSIEVRFEYIGSDLYGSMELAKSLNLK